MLRTVSGICKHSITINQNFYHYGDVKTELFQVQKYCKFSPCETFNHHRATYQGFSNLSQSINSLFFSLTIHPQIFLSIYTLKKWEKISFICYEYLRYCVYFYPLTQLYFWGKFSCVEELLWVCLLKNDNYTKWYLVSDSFNLQKLQFHRFNLLSYLHFCLGSQEN